MKRKISLLAFLFSVLFSPALRAQANDECSGATVITDPSNFCTAGDDNSFATPSPEPTPSCFGANAQTDVWYTFTAIAPDVLIVVKGATPSNPTGTLSRPLIALYAGDCNNLTEIGCANDVAGTNNLPLYRSGLVVGQQYYIRIDAVFGGAFQCCVKNQNSLSVVSSDCPTGTLICSKNPIQVAEVYGPGNDPFEVNTAPCFVGTGESSSAWYVFTAANDGTLEFTLTPNNPTDDLDFIVYRLPNGPGDCTGKIIERCMGAGDLDPNSPCMGPTGLNATATDISQPFGCNPGQDNWLRFMNLVSGRTYALMVNDYTSIGNGFMIEWGGTAIFKGNSTANFKTDEPDKKICLGEELLLTDSSYTTDGTITNWYWDFGLGGVSDSITGQGPKTVQYGTLGPKTIILTIVNEEGCSSLDTAFVLVEDCCAINLSVNAEPGCPDDPAATTTVSIENALSPLLITWSDGQVGADTMVDIASSGTYTVTVVDALGCSDTRTFVVNTPLNVNALFPPDTSILQGASITLGTVSMPTDSLLVWWIGPDFDTLTGPVQTFKPDETITYFVVVNNTGCVFTDSVTVTVKIPRYERPNAFTPNGDGSNDLFGPVLVGNTLIQLEIWSRWGEKVFDSINEGKNAWDGTINGAPAPSDVYVYRMRVRLVEGVEKVDKGDVTLLR